MIEQARYRPPAVEREREEREERAHRQRRREWLRHIPEAMGGHEAGWHTGDEVMAAIIRNGDSKSLARFDQDLIDAVQLGLLSIHLRSDELGHLYRAK